jgi:hypothetical protein
MHSRPNSKGVSRRPPGIVGPGCLRADQTRRSSSRNPMDHDSRRGWPTLIYQFPNHRGTCASELKGHCPPGALTRAKRAAPKWRTDGGSQAVVPSAPGLALRSQFELRLVVGDISTADVLYRYHAIDHQVAFEASDADGWSASVKYWGFSCHPSCPLDHNRFAPCSPFLSHARRSPRGSRGASGNGGRRRNYWLRGKDTRRISTAWPGTSRESDADD